MSPKGKSQSSESSGSAMNPSRLVAVKYWVFTAELRGSLALACAMRTSRPQAPALTSGPQPDIGAACPPPCAGNRSEGVGVGAHQPLLLLRGQFDHCPTGARMTQSSENAFFHPEIGMAHVRRFSYFGQAKCQPAELMGGHRCRASLPQPAARACPDHSSFSVIAHQLQHDREVLAHRPIGEDEYLGGVPPLLADPRLHTVLPPREPSAVVPARHQTPAHCGGGT